MTWSNLHRTRTLARLAATVFGVLAWALIGATAAQAADAVFPVGSRVGLVPPPDMKPSSTFVGFADAENSTIILVAAFPAEAFAALEKSMTPDALKKQGIDTREPMTIAGGTGFLLTGKQTVEGTSYRKWMLVAPVGGITALVTLRAPDQSKKYTDQMVRTLLATVAVRPNVPDSERLGLLPFKVGDLAGFRIDDVLPGRALMLVDIPAGADQSGKTAPAGNKVAAGQPIDARFLIAALPGGPTETKDDDTFARVTFDQIGGITNVRVQDAEPLRIGNQSGYETLAKAKDPQGTDLMVVQWLRFGTGGYMQMVGISNADQWPGMLMRLRKIRDSINVE
jgi:hypothetical protein